MCVWGGGECCATSRLDQPSGLLQCPPYPSSMQVRVVCLSWRGGLDGARGGSRGGAVCVCECWQHVWEGRGKCCTTSKRDQPRGLLQCPTYQLSMQVRMCLEGVV